MKVSGQKLAMQEFGSLINKSYWGYIKIEYYPLMSCQVISNKKESPKEILH